MAENTKIYPYIQTIKSLEYLILDENFNIAFLQNNEKVLVHKDCKVNDKLFILPKKAICSYEFYQSNFAFESFYNHETYEILPFSYDGEMFTNRAIPLSLLTINNDISLENLNSISIDSPIKSLKLNNNEDLIVIPDYSKESINYVFEPVTDDENEELSMEALSMEDLKVPSTPNSKQILKPDQIEKLLEIKSMDDFKKLNISHRDWIVSIFSNRAEKVLDKDGNPTKQVKILPPLIPIEGYFTLPANTLPNQPKDIETTAGLYVFNMFVIAAAFKHKIPYINHEMKAPDMEKLNNDLSFLLIQNKIQVKDELEVYWNNVTFISYMTEIFMPGIPVDFIEELPEVKKLKKELCEKYKDEIARGDAAFYADNVEKPLLKLAESILKEHPSWDIYGLGKKPTFDNNYKTCFVSNGPIYNSITEGYDIVTNAFDDGIDKSKYAAYCNQLIYGTYNRAVKTAYGGALSKTIFNSLSGIRMGDAGSDCGTEKTYNFILEKDQKKDYFYTYIRNPFYGKESNKLFPSNDKWIELTPEIIDMFIGKEVQMRSPLYCEAERYCNKCMGNLFIRMGIQHANLTASVMMRTIMSKSMKSYHDVSIKTILIKLENYLK